MKPDPKHKNKRLSVRHYSAFIRDCLVARPLNIFLSLFFFDLLISLFYI